MDRDKLEKLFSLKFINNRVTPIDNCNNNQDEVQLKVHNSLFGISEQDILTLLDHYDNKRHGRKSFNDFLHFLQDYSDVNSESNIQSNTTRKSVELMQLHQSNDNDDSSIFDLTNPRELEWRLKVFLENFEAYLIKYAQKLSRTRLVGLSGVAAEENYRHLSRYTSQQYESIAMTLLSKMFAVYVTSIVQIDSKIDKNCIEFDGFSLVIRSFQFPGCSPVTSEIVQHVFDLCSKYSVFKCGSVVDLPILNADGNKMASPALLVKLVFGNTSPVECRRPATAISPRASPPMAMSKWKRQGSPRYLRGRDGNQAVGFGPIRMNGLTQPTKLSVQIIKYHSAVPEIPPRPVPGSSSDSETGTTATNSSSSKSRFSLPLKLATRKSRTSLAVPARFDTVTDIQRSNSLPKQDLRRKHVFGMSSTLYSGSAISILPLVGPTATASPVVVAYASAGLGVLHDLASNSQTHYNGHTDDITCMALSTDGILAATGCNGKEPTVHVWDTEISDPTAPPFFILGKGFFYLAVCAVEFSFDCRFLFAMSCDEHHMVGVFNLFNGEKVCHTTGQKGLPPIIKWMRHCPGMHNTLHISKEHSEPCDVFCTAGGERHIKLWSFLRPQKDGTGASLASKALKMGQSGATAPKAYLCCRFVPCAENNLSFDLITGGCNGVLYRFRGTSLTTFKQAMTGKIQCLDIILGESGVDYMVAIGGSNGVVKVLDGASFAELHSFCLVESAPVVRQPSQPNSPRSSRPTSARRGNFLRQKDGAKAAAEITDTATTAISVRASTGTVAEELPPESKMVTGLAVTTQGRTCIIATLGVGKAVMLELPSTPSANQSKIVTDSTDSVTRRVIEGDSDMIITDITKAKNPTTLTAAKTLFYYHTGSVCGLAVASKSMCVTVGDDKQLMLWDASNCQLVSKTTLDNPSRACHIDKSKTFIAVGCTAGAITLYHLTYPNKVADGSTGTSAFSTKIEKIASRKDSKGECTEVKFSPSNIMIAVGTRDDVIYIYGWGSELPIPGQVMSTTGAQQPTSACLKLLHKLKGHTATILHIDWSADSQLIQSVCNAYEIICWDVPVGKVNATVNPADVRWKTRNCKLGFHVMGIWPACSNGSEVNSVDVCVEKGLVVTANDSAGLTRLFNYPCVVKVAPNKAYTGHSAHVTQCRFFAGGDALATVGGRDASLQFWDCLP